MGRTAKQVTDENGNWLCTKCGLYKSAFDFYRDSNRRTGITVWCKSCMNGNAQERKEAIAVQTNETILALDARIVELETENAKLKTIIDGYFELVKSKASKTKLGEGGGGGGVGSCSGGSDGSDSPDVPVVS